MLLSLMIGCGEGRNRNLLIPKFSVYVLQYIPLLMYIYTYIIMQCDTADVHIFILAVNFMWCFKETLFQPYVVNSLTGKKKQSTVIFLS